MKNYIKPQIYTLYVDAETIMAASELEGVDGTATFEQGFGDGLTTGDALGKGHISVWGDDEEE